MAMFTKWKFRKSASGSLLVCLFLFTLNLGLPEAKENQICYKLNFTKDTIVSSVADEQTGNCGKNNKLKLKSQQEMVLFDIDPQLLKGQLVSSAKLHVRSAASKKAPFGRVSISTLASPWSEGGSIGYLPEEGASCFKQARYQIQDWAYPGSSLMDVVMGKGNTIWNFSDCTQPDKQGWQTCAVSPDVLAARLAGLSYGFCLYDDIGTTWSILAGKFTQNIFPNRFFYSREALNGKPWLEVQVSGTDKVPPLPVKEVYVLTKDYPAGEALLSWKTPEDTGGGKTLGFYVEYERREGERGEIPRFLVPMAGQAGDIVRMHLRDLSFESGEQIKVSITPVDNVGNKGRPYSRIVKLASVQGAPVIPAIDIVPFPSSTTLPEVNGLKIAIVDLLDKIDPVSGDMVPQQRVGYKGGNHLYSAVKSLVRLQSARNETTAFVLNLEGNAREVEVSLHFDNHPQIKTRFYQFSYVKTGKDLLQKNVYFPDPLVELGGIFSVPSNAGSTKIPNQTNTSLLCELYVPHDIPAGDLPGKLIVVSGSDSVELKVALKVWNFTLPNKLSFVPEMNAYSKGSPYSGYDYYRLAHEHRTCFNLLPYGWTGRPAFSPKWDGRAFDWTQWDVAMGPLLDGSAFADLPRRNEPIDVMYLPFNENWPVNLSTHYTPSYWVDSAFDEAYKNELSRAFSIFAKHCDDKGWHGPIFQFYLNNKLYYKRKNPQSSAPWVFDEPVDTKDFWALRWYGALFRSAVAESKGQSKFWFRGDISYSQFSRDILWGVTDVEYLGGNNFQKTRMKEDEQLFSKSYFAEYGSANKIEEANTQPVLWCLSAWSKGAIGVLPWQTIGNERSWRFADQNALFYPSEKGPVPSVRLKAFTRGQQDVEYLVLFSVTFQRPFWLTANLWRSEFDGLRSEVYKSSLEDAGMQRFSSVSPAQLWQLRYRIGSLISGKAPPYKRVLVERSRQGGGIARRSILGYVPMPSKVWSLAPDFDGDVVK